MTSYSIKSLEMRSLLLLFTFLTATVAFRAQSVAVNGKLLCGNEPATDILVKLIDQDAGK